MAEEYVVSVRRLLVFEAGFVRSARNAANRAALVQVEAVAGHELRHESSAA